MPQSLKNQAKTLFKRHMTLNAALPILASRQPVNIRGMGFTSEESRIVFNGSDRVIYP